MSLKQIDAILWRKYLAATSHAIWEVSSSQYYFEMPDRGYEEFFGGNCHSFTDKDGNKAFTISLQAFDGVPPSGNHDVTFTKKRDTAARVGWTVDSIRDGKSAAYDLWRRKRGPLDEYKRLLSPEKEKNYIVIVRDDGGEFHGRWIRGSDFDALPTAFQKLLLSDRAGWAKL